MKPTSDVVKAIETAIQIEKDGLAFYTEAARQTGDPNGKKMFQSLARDEAAHLRLFKDDYFGESLRISFVYTTISVTMVVKMGCRTLALGKFM